MGEQTIGILPVLVTQVALQAVLALILEGILAAFHRLYRLACLRHWALSWLALVVYVGASTAAGLMKQHNAELAAFLNQALSL